MRPVGGRRTKEIIARPVLPKIAAGAEPDRVIESLGATVNALVEKLEKNVDLGNLS